MEFAFAAWSFLASFGALVIVAHCILNRVTIVRIERVSVSR